MVKNWIHPLRPFLEGEIYVFHINSLDKEDLICPEGVHLIDIGLLSTFGILRKLKEIRPDAYISLGFRSLIELMLVRLCRKVGIKSVYLEHGLYTVDTARLNTSNLKRNTGYVVKKYQNFVIKYVQYLFLCRCSFRELRAFHEGFVKKNYINSKFDKALFFGQYGFAETNKLFHYPNHDVVFCGYPLFQSNKERDEVSETIVKKKDNAASVIYVHQPFILNHQTSISYAEEVCFIRTIWNKIRTEFYAFQVLLHPRENIERYVDLFSGTDIEVIQKPNDYRVFLGANLVIGHYSTALLYSLYFNIETVIMDYPKAKIDKLYTSFCSYAESPNELCDKIIKSGHSNKKEYNIELLVGPVNSYENVAREIRGLLCWCQSEKNLGRSFGEDQVS